MNIFTADKNKPVFEEAKGGPLNQVFSHRLGKYESIFPGLSEAKPDKGAFVYCRENASAVEWAWFAAKIAQRMKKQYDATHFFVKCDKCGNRGWTLGALLGSACRRCTTTRRKETSPGVFQSERVEGHLVEMTPEEKVKYLSDKAKWEAEIKAKELAAKKIRETIQRGNEGAGNMYARPIPHYAELPEPKAKGKK